MDMTRHVRWLEHLQAALEAHCALRPDPEPLVVLQELLGVV